MIIIGFAAGISHIKLEDDFLRYFDESFETRQATDLYETELGGLNCLEYSVDTGIESGINSGSVSKNSKIYRISFARSLRLVTYARLVTRSSD